MPKHLQEMSPEHREQLQKGYNAFRFGFAQPGEVHGSAIYVGNFTNRNKAYAERDRLKDEGKNVTCNGYLFGKLARGWSVWVVQPESAAS